MLTTERWPLDPRAPVRPPARALVCLEAPAEAALRTALAIEKNNTTMWQQIALASHNTIAVLRRHLQREMSRSSS